MNESTEQNEPSEPPATPTQVPTRQEMFNRAWNGLKSQGWNHAAEGTVCVYLTKDGRRCAWGWVDPENTPYRIRTLIHLRADNVGIAGRLSYPDYLFAIELQSAHDSWLGSAPSLELAMSTLASRYKLTVPEHLETA